MSVPSTDIGGAEGEVRPCKRQRLNPTAPPPDPPTPLNDWQQIAGHTPTASHDHQVYAQSTSTRFQSPTTDPVPVHSSEAATHTTSCADGLVCYGRVPDQPVRTADLATTLDPVTSISLSRQIGGLALRISPSEPPLSTGNKDYDTVLSALEEYPDLVLQCDLIVDNVPQARKRSAAVSVTLYGPWTTSHHVAEYLYDADIYLQIPVRASRNVPYCNPQSLSSDLTKATLTFDLQSSTEQEPQSTLDPASLLEANQDLPETAPSAKIKSSMFRHQRQALTFMAHRECAAFANESYQALVQEHDLSYRSNSTLRKLHRSIDLYRGGILADAMGLGKTLSMISLICQESYKPQVKNAGTLIVVPLSLLKTWDDQLTQHVHSGTMKWMVYHASNAPLDSLPGLDSVDVVITTYDVIASHWSRGDHRKLLLFTLTWDRLILDEAHEVRSANTLRAEAVSNVRARCRWAVTGTPIQNHTDDLASLLRVLNVFPGVVIRRLKALCRDVVSDQAMKNAMTRICLRRSKRTVFLPERVDLQHLVLFDEEERKTYRQIQAQARDQLQWDDRSRLRAHALIKINALRQICNLGSRFSGSLLANPAGETNPEDLMDSVLSTTSGSCQYCGCQDSGLALKQSDDEAEFSQGGALISSCGLLICAACATVAAADALQCNCSASEPCRYERLDSQQRPSLGLPDITSEYVSSKTSALVSNIEAIPLDEKALVFSSWATTLTAAEEALTAKGIGLCRLQGSHTATQRWATITQFNTDANIRVLLISIRCGSTGMTLTRANHVFLMEPQWNPMLEEQALCRVHRIGQTRPTKTVRFIVSGTIEEKIREIQTKKKQVFEDAFKGSETSWMERVQDLIA